MFSAWPQPFQNATDLCPEAPARILAQWRSSWAESSAKSWAESWLAVQNRDFQYKSQ